MMVNETQPNKSENLDRRADSVTAAHALIVEKGFEGLRVREVAEHAGIHHATLLHYFPSKEALIRGVVESIVAQLDRVPAAAHSLSPREALHAHFSHVLEQMRAAPEQFTVLSELFMRASRDQGLRDVLADTDRSWQAFLVPLLERGRDEGAFRSDLDAEAAATLITSTFKGFAFELTLTPEGAQRTMDQLERWLVGGA